MSKRSIDSPAPSNSSMEEKLTTSSMEYESKPLVSPPKKVKPSNKSKKDSPEKRVRRSWTVEEEAIYLDIVIEHLQGTFPQFWDKIKEDGRLVERGCTGIKVHFASIMNKLKKTA